MDRTTTENDIRLLIRCVETSLGRAITSPRDFTFLRDCIFARLHTYLSESTLKRVWGYMPRGETRIHTLDLLAAFAGYRSWHDFLDNADNGIPSSFVLGRHLSADEDLTIGQRLQLVWQPGRRCTVKLVAPRRFEVIESENTRLRPGDTFSCAFIIEGEPLYIDSLVQGDRAPVSYVCGRLSGVRFQLL